MSNEEQTKVAQRVNFKRLKLELYCEWGNCDFNTKILNDMKQHLLDHLKELYKECNKSQVTELRCGICYEGLEANLSSIRHINYHAYIFNLKSRGRYIKKLYKLNDCQADETNQNAVPPLDDSLECQWLECTYKTDDVSEFFDHIDNHPYMEDYRENKGNNCICKWSECQYETCTIASLVNHLKLHCEKRLLACPKCGFCFVSTIKFTDHLKRQLVNNWYKEMEEREVKEVLVNLSSDQNPTIPIAKPIIDTPKGAFRCGLCQHLFATKRMLKDHEKRHISSLNCPHCNHTCSTRYALKRHILFRHTEEKPYACDQCTRSFKSKDVLRRHIQSVHADAQILSVISNPVTVAISQQSVKPELNSQPTVIKSDNVLYGCGEMGCSFIGKNMRALQIHKGKTHSNMHTITTKVYVCHKCNMEFVKGSLLTNHLLKSHNFRRFHNRVRHQYKVCKDGKYRLNIFDIQLKSSVNTEPQFSHQDPITSDTEHNHEDEEEVHEQEAIKIENKEQEEDHGVKGEKMCGDEISLNVNNQSSLLISKQLDGIEMNEGLENVVFNNQFYEGLYNLPVSTEIDSTNYQLCYGVDGSNICLINDPSSQINYVFDNTTDQLNPNLIPNNDNFAYIFNINPDDNRDDNDDVHGGGECDDSTNNNNSNTLSKMNSGLFEEGVDEVFFI